MSQGSQTKSREQQNTRKRAEARRRLWGRRALSPQERGQGRRGWAGAGGGGRGVRASVRTPGLTPGQREATSTLRVQGDTPLVCTWKSRPGEGGAQDREGSQEVCSSRRRRKRTAGEPVTPSSHCPRHWTESEGTVRPGKEDPGEPGHPEPELCGFGEQATRAPHRTDRQTAVPQGGRQWPGRP